MVRHRTLTPAYAGSNPATPAIWRCQNFQLLSDIFLAKKVSPKAATSCISAVASCISNVGGFEIFSAIFDALDKRLSYRPFTAGIRVRIS